MSTCRPTKGSVVSLESHAPPSPPKNAIISRPQIPPPRLLSEGCRAVKTQSCHSSLCGLAARRLQLRVLRGRYSAVTVLKPSGPLWELAGEERPCDAFQSPGNLRGDAGKQAGCKRERSARPAAAAASSTPALQPDGGIMSEIVAPRTMLGRGIETARRF